MNGFRFGSAAEVPDSTYVELVESLFATRLPAIVMSLLFTAAGGVICWHAHDGTLTGLFAAGVAMSAVRIAVALPERRRLSLSRHRARTAAQVERRFAATYLAFAACLVSCLRSF